jgi:hypothetical protein
MGDLLEVNKEIFDYSLKIAKEAFKEAKGESEVIGMPLDEFLANVFMTAIKDVHDEFKERGYVDREDIEKIIQRFLAISLAFIMEEDEKDNSTH